MSSKCLISLFREEGTWRELQYMGVEFKRASAASNVLWAIGGDHQVGSCSRCLGYWMKTMNHHEPGLCVRLRPRGGDPGEGVCVREPALEPGQRIFRPTLAY